MDGILELTLVNLFRIDHTYQFFRSIEKPFLWSSQANHTLPVRPEDSLLQGSHPSWKYCGHPTRLRETGLMTSGSCNKLRPGRLEPRRFLPRPSIVWQPASIFLCPMSQLM